MAGLTEDEMRAAVDLYRAHGNNAHRAALAVGMSRPGLEYRLERAALKGLMGTGPVLPGFQISKTTTVKNEAGETVREFITQKPEAGEEYAVPNGHRVKGVSAYVGADGRTVAQWIKTSAGEVDAEGLAERIKGIFEGLSFKAPKVAPPDATNKDCLTLFNVPDLHMGEYVWSDEGEENWDLKKADRVYREAFSDLVARSPHGAVAVLLAGGDQFHADNSENRTPRSGFDLDVDGRYDKVLRVTCEMFLFFALCALKTHEKVVIRILKGNHDPHASSALAYFLMASFRNDPRVEVDVSPSPFWVYQFGKVMLAATHGHEAKPKQMPAIMASRWPKMWGATRYRYAHTFHVHHRSKPLPFGVEETGGAIVETHQSPAPQDRYHYGHGYLSGRSLRSIVYHKTHGEFGGAVRPIVAE